MLTLVVGNKNYSSWSLRAWLALAHSGLPFEEIVIPLSEPGTRQALLGHSPAGLVPVLKHDHRVVWESLAILEYLAELAPAAGLWPADQEARAFARSISAEMHSGFRALRAHMPMNLRRTLPGRGMAPGVADDIARVTEIWQSCRERFGEGGPYLFGRFTAADAMYAPVATRFRTYAVETGPCSAAYVATIYADAHVQSWYHAACAEPWVIAEDEVA